ncbi:cytochrome c3 family protein [Sinimarinibacterium sp. NLF-5-8]|uniref:cytochrome c3 family protein n=1 Tax=Sinimarinibacterium sp. NLF-5-8 TaxID=2698684 RepID=UPI00137C1436|nr:cytochrome c3 family protein [Sinimarinibacterium sp. NLF-5-8]QHS11205.1 cytochrome c3 family protein [Sinimarinibacterium sp. NLF-5-8]
MSPPPEHHKDGATPTITSLAEAGWRLRRPAVILAVLITLLCLLVPLLLRGIGVPAAAKRWLPSDAQWSSGQISNAHVQFGQNCEVCHQTLLVPVRDEACLACHSGIAEHGDDAAVLRDAGLDTRRCASCHFEHGGPHAVQQRHPALCADCHAAPERYPSLKDVAAVSDFARAHPPFKVTVAVAGQSARARVLLDAQARDVSGLIFPHDLHLDARGIQGADGKQVLQCADCHRPLMGGAGFEPLRYSRDCQSCHQLDVDLNGRQLRLPHGNNEAARALLQRTAALAPLATPPPVDESEDRRRPGARADRGDARQQPGAVDEVFERRVCAKCHSIVSDSDGSRVQPPQLAQTWMPLARFDHAPHRWVGCDSCHAAQQSQDADDLLLPQIESCRQCHGGINSHSKIQSTCIDCHRFHQAHELTSQALGSRADEQTQQ